ncbi:phosphoribosyl-AMP cyclohydrolase [Methanonatronarchaeum sp. AMET6-2]|uniref:phosphoribosyl-AMP cyclohydrolase n=1 Tax=Methanonatronarchaeum sp. AMET6-2 TaxID=2933293 RepID=UPI0011FE468E|nr:phosphoribosyl-AMP cyclohydrolase [Methanonatronarchaeum sp. AMET6-2]RZN60539.1 MAG: phosphoribosyl-AMP cyclohydrolase [Methanonatronarchaeia archaeon]UOY10471.1 phosphoribosyl-AMP cyclohydrolase [Methanonatronarchaeum sp. AMET6-2]
MKDIESIDIKEKLNFKKGLITAVVQESDTNKVLMVAHMNEEAFKKTLEEETAHYYSRSRQKLWKKGEESGNTQKVDEMYIDCDGDTVLLKVTQSGGACHTGHHTCFYRKLNEDGFSETEEKIFDPDEVYGD